MQWGKFSGSVLIVAGSALGAGMLAMPMVSAAAGFSNNLILLVITWLLLMFSALFIVEVTLAFPALRNNFNSMAKTTLGSVGQITAWISLCLLLYAGTAAYISGDSSLLINAEKSLFHYYLPSGINSILFTLVFGTIVYLSTRHVDLFVRFFMSLKGFCLIIMLSLLLPRVHLEHLVSQPGTAKYLLFASPIFLMSFAFHFVIPSIATYIGEKPKQLQWIMIVGSFIPLFIYALWMAATLGLVPLEGTQSFTSLAKSNGSVGEFIAIINALVNNKWVTLAVDGFANVAMTTSFLGVTLGLFDFLADGLNRSNSRAGRLQTALITYIPPLLFALFYPKGFIIAFTYAAIFGSILLLILPPLMTLSLRRSDNLSSPYRVPGGYFTIGIVLLGGLYFTSLAIIHSFHLIDLPHL